MTDKTELLAKPDCMRRGPDSLQRPSWYFLLITTAPAGLVTHKVHALNLLELARLLHTFLSIADQVTKRHEAADPLIRLCISCRQCMLLLMSIHYLDT